MGHRLWSHVIVGTRDPHSLAQSLSPVPRSATSARCDSNPDFQNDCPRSFKALFLPWRLPPNDTTESNHLPLRSPFYQASCTSCWGSPTPLFPPSSAWPVADAHQGGGAGTRVALFLYLCLGGVLRGPVLERKGSRCVCFVRLLH